MANITWLVIMMVCINLALVFGGAMDTTATKDEGGVISSFFDIDSKFNSQNIGSEFQNTTKGVTERGVVAGTEFEGFTDTPSAVSGLFTFLFDVSTAPFQLVANPNLELPVPIRMFIGLPLSLAWIFAIISFWRKGI